MIDIKHCISYKLFASALLISGMGMFPAIVSSVRGAVSAGNADFYVSTAGSDAWSGRMAKANPTHTDGPFATIARARDAARKLKSTSAQGDIRIRIRGGVYVQPETLVFSIAHSAGEGRTITYEAYPNETPVISSGIPIRSWQKPTEEPVNLPAVARGKVWVAELPSKLTRILSLYDGNERLPRARGEGFAPIAFVDKRTYAPDKIAFPAGAMRNWSGLTDAELLVIPSADYEMCILPLASVNQETLIATTVVPASRPMGKVKFFPASAWVENVFEVLDQPGEWVLNTKERRIYYWPRNGQPGDHIVAPTLTELVRVEGRIDYDGPKDEPVRGLVFRGLTFSHAERFPWHGRTGWNLQHHWEMFDRPTAALRFRGAEGCVVQACRFIATSGTALRLDLHCQTNRVVDNEIGHVGGMGILLAGYGPGNKDVNKGNEVSNNWLHHTGELYWATPAILLWQSGENHVAHNLIHDTPYSGIAISCRTPIENAEMVQQAGQRTVRTKDIADPSQYRTWYERERFLHGRKNLVEYNDIHDVMQVMGDGNGVYISGTGGKNRIYQNYIHHIDGDHMAQAIRCDDDQFETIIEGNIIYRVRCVGQGISISHPNYISNNIIVDVIPSRRNLAPANIVRGYLGLLVSPMNGAQVNRNIVYATRKEYPAIIEHRQYGRGLDPRLRDTVADFNLYWCPEDPQWGQQHLDRQRPFNVETHSLCADPLFVDVEKGDLRLKPESPAWKLGFQPVEISKTGLLPGHPYYAAKSKTK